MLNRAEKESVAFLARLRNEASGWVADGTVTEEQGEKILGRYDFGVVEAAVEVERSRPVAIVTMAGAALVGLGVILFFAANWPEIPRWGRFGIIVAGMFALHAAGYEVGWRRGGYPLTGKALVAGGCLLFGAGIWQVAQAFNISSHEPNGLLLWALGILPVALVLSTSPLLSLHAILLVSWAMMESTGFEASVPLFFILLPFTVFLPAYRAGHRFPVVVGVYGFIQVLTFETLRWGAEGVMRGGPAPLFVLPAVGALLAVVARSHDGSMFGRFGWIHRLAGLLLAGSLLLPFTFREMWADWTRDASFDLRVFGLLVLAVAGTGALTLLNTRRSELEGGDAAFVRIEGAVMFGTATVVALAYILQGRVTSGAWAFASLANVVSLAFCGFLVFAADRTKSWWMGYLGVILFTVLVTCRYFEYAVELMPKSFIFLLAGAILLGGGSAMERRRRAAKVAEGGAR